MKYFFITLVIFIIGCGAEPDDFDIEKAGLWSGKWVERNDNFIVNYDTNVIDGPLLDGIEETWLASQTCVGIPTRAGLVIEYTHKSEIQDGYNGYILYHKKYIRVQETDYSNKILAHEFIHWILHVANASEFDNKEHNSDYFSNCA